MKGAVIYEVRRRAINQFPAGTTTRFTPKTMKTHENASFIHTKTDQFALKLTNQINQKRVSLFWLDPPLSEDVTCALAASPPS